MAEQKNYEALVKEAHKRFERCESYEADARSLWKADLRFAHGDPDNGWQWDEMVKKSRELSRRPCLTVNKVKQHNRQITNDARQNKPAVKVSPVDNGADRKTAEVFNGIIRHIEANSNADAAYDTASEFAVDAGIGYWRVVTDYASDDSFDQEIFIRLVKNPLNVYLDGDIQQPDGSDARFGFVFEDLPKDEFEARYPDCEPVGWPLEGGSDWLGKDSIRVCEYFRRVEKADVLYVDEGGNTFKASDMGKEQVVAAAAAGWRSRPIKRHAVEWYLIAGDKVLEKREWPGIYIPIVRVVGEEVEIDGKVERKGHTRAMKDAQRMYNYNSSAAIEYGALQTKTPIISPAEAIAGYEKYWENANTENLAYLPYNAYDENSNPIPMPQRMVAPAPAQLFLQGMATASEEMKMASGQYDASMGAKSNETSGRAIMARQREGDTATFHFIDNVARAIKYTGKILVDLIPKIYDSERVVRILGEDGKDSMVKIDPNMPKAYDKRETYDGIEEIYNPSVGRYDVTVTVGPSYSTKRQEAFQALSDIASRSPDLMNKAGDLIMQAADFPMADQLAERLKKTLPPGLGDDNSDSPEVQQMQQQMQQLQGQLQALGAEHNKVVEDKTLEADKLKVAAYEATTKRLGLVIDRLPPEALAAIAQEIGLDVVTAPDITPPEQMQPQEPAQAGFFTPNESQQ